MPRKKELAFETERNTFSVRLRQIMAETHTTQKKLGEAIKMRPQTVSLYMNGQSLPDALTVRSICEYFNISADWLLGRPNSVRSTNKDLQSICMLTHLSEKSAQRLCSLARNDEAAGSLKVLDLMICNDNEEDDLLWWLAEYMATIMVRNLYFQSGYDPSMLQSLTNDLKQPYAVRIQARYSALLEEFLKKGRADSFDADARKFNLTTDEFNWSMTDLCALRLNKAFSQFIQLLETYVNRETLCEGEENGQHPKTHK